MKRFGMRPAVDDPGSWLESFLVHSFIGASHIRINNTSVQFPIRILYAARTSFGMNFYVTHFNGFFGQFTDRTQIYCGKKRRINLDGFGIGRLSISSWISHFLTENEL